MVDPVQYAQLPGPRLPLGSRDTLLVLQDGELKRANPKDIVQGSPPTALPAHASSHEEGGSDPIALPSGTAMFTTVGPTLLAIAASVVMTHPAVTNEKIMVTASKASDAEGLTRLQADFDVGDAGDFTYDTDKLTFASGVVKLKDISSGLAPVTFSDAVRDSSTTAHATPSFGGSVLCSSADADAGTSWGLQNTMDFSDMASIYQSAGGGDNTITWDLGALKTVGKITAMRDSNGIGYGLSAGEFFISSNGTDWTSVGSYTTGAGLADLDLPVNASARYIKVELVQVLYSTSSFRKLKITTQAPAEYAINEFSTVETKNASQFPFSGSSQTVTVNAVTFDKTLPANTNIKVLVSFDGRVTWKKRSGGAWVTVSGDDLLESTTWNTIAEMEAGFPYTVQEGDVGLDWLVDLSTSVASATPELSGISINYDEELVFDIASVGPTGSDAEVFVTRLTPTTTRFTNNTGAEKTFLFNAITG